MAFIEKTWKDLPAELEPQAGETLADWFARLAAYDAAHPGELTGLNAASLTDLEARIKGVDDTAAAAQAAADEKYTKPAGGIPAADVAADVATREELDAVAAVKADADATTAALAGKLDASEKGQPDGVAELDATGKVPAAQLPDTAGGGSLTVVDGGTDLTTARPDAPVVYWQFDAGVDVGTDGANVVNRQPGDLIFVASA